MYYYYTRVYSVWFLMSKQYSLQPFDYPRRIPNKIATGVQIYELAPRAILILFGHSVLRSQYDKVQLQTASKLVETLHPKRLLTLLTFNSYLKFT